MIDIYDNVINLLHEVKLVLPEASNEEKILWCYNQSNKIISEKQIKSISEYYKLENDINEYLRTVIIPNDLVYIIFE